MFNLLSNTKIKELQEENFVLAKSLGDLSAKCLKLETQIKELEERICKNCGCAKKLEYPDEKHQYVCLNDDVNLKLCELSALSGYLHVNENFGCNQFKQKEKNEYMDTCKWKY